MRARKHFKRGLKHYDAHQYDEAQREFTLAIEMAPDFADPLTGRGYIYSHKSDYQNALTDFSNAIRLNPFDADAWMGRAEARQIMGNYEESIADYDEAIRLYSDDAHFFHRRGDAHSINGDIHRAIEDYRQAIALDPSNPISHYFLAINLTRIHSYAEAIHRYEETLRIDYNLDPEVFAFNAWLLVTCPDVQLRDPTKAIQLAKSACEYTGWCEDQPLGILAAAYASNGDFTNAIRWQSEAVEYADDERVEIQQTRLETYRQGKVCPYSDDP